MVARNKHFSQLFNDKVVPFRFMAALGLGSSVSLAALLRSPASKGTRLKHAGIEKPHMLGSAHMWGSNMLAEILRQGIHNIIWLAAELVSSEQFCKFSCFRQCCCIGCDLRGRYSCGMGVVCSGFILEFTLGKCKDYIFIR